MTIITVVRAVRWAVAGALWVTGAYAAALGVGLPMEMGGLFLGPILLGCGAACALLGLMLVVPRRLLRGRDVVRRPRR